MLYLKITFKGEIKMKKVVLLAVLFLSFVMVGCGKSSEENLQETMEKYARSYYEKYGTSVSGQMLTYEVTLGSLKDLNKSNSMDEKDKYDLSDFTAANCKDSTKASLKIDDNQKVKSVTVKLNCK